MTEAKFNKKVIYTCITGGYDRLEDPKFISEGFDYVCFTDTPFESDIWQIKEIPLGLDNLSKSKQNRNIKINPHLYLKEYDFSIYVDANVLLKGDVNEYIEKNCKNKDVSIFIGRHPTRNCIYDEAKAVIKFKKDTIENVNRQMEIYKKEGFPKNMGLSQNTIIFRYHNNEDCIRLMEAWWKEVEMYSHRDQLSFNYAAWKNSDIKIGYLNKSIFNCNCFVWKGSHQNSLKKPSNFVNATKAEFANTRASVNKNPADRVIVKSYFSRKAVNL